MSSKLPMIDGRTAIKAFRKIGFEVVRVEGSHHIMKRNGHFFSLAVPVHGAKELKRGTLRDLISDAGLSVAEFVALL